MLFILTDYEFTMSQPILDEPTEKSRLPSDSDGMQWWTMVTMAMAGRGESGTSRNHESDSHNRSYAGKGSAANCGSHD